MGKLSLNYSERMVTSPNSNLYIKLCYKVAVFYNFEFTLPCKPTRLYDGRNHEKVTLSDEIMYEQQAKLLRN